MIFILSEYKTSYLLIGNSYSFNQIWKKFMRNHESPGNRSAFFLCNATLTRSGTIKPMR